MWARGAKQICKNKKNIGSYEHRWIAAGILMGTGVAFSYGKHSFVAEEWNGDSMYQDSDTRIDSPFLPPSETEITEAFESNEERKKESSETHHSTTHSCRHCEGHTFEEISESSQVPELQEHSCRHCEENNDEFPSLTEELIQKTEDVGIKEGSRTFELLQSFLEAEKGIISANQVIILRDHFQEKYHKKLEKKKKKIEKRYKKAVEELKDDYKASLASSTKESIEESIDHDKTIRKQELREYTEERIIVCHENLNLELKELVNDAEKQLDYELRVTTNDFMYSWYQTQLNKNLKREKVLRNLLDAASSMEKRLEDENTKKMNASSSQKIALYALALDDRVRTSQPFGNQLRLLRSLADDKPELKKALDNIPKELEDELVPSIMELAEEFAQQKAEVRRAMFLPSSGPDTFVWRTLSSFFAYVTFPLKGNIKGTDPEAILARAEYQLSRGNLKGAVQTIEKLNGKPKQVLNEWVKKSSQYLTITKLINEVRNASVAEMTKN